MPELSANLQALLARVAEGAARSCGADDAVVWLFEGAELHPAAHFGPQPVPTFVSDLSDRTA